MGNNRNSFFIILRDFVSIKAKVLAPTRLKNFSQNIIANKNKFFEFFFIF